MVGDPDSLLGENFGFSIYFSPTLFSSLADPPPGVNADWDAITLQPDPGLAADGLYDALSLSAAPTLADPFTAQFIWLGGAGTLSGVQPFDINEFDANGDFLGSLQSGVTVAGVVAVPEPNTSVWGLLSGALLLMHFARQRSRAPWILLLWLGGWPGRTALTLRRGQI